MLSFPSQSRLSFPCRTSFRATVKHSEATLNKSLYEVLRVKRNASQTEIKTAYRTLAKLYHPDATTRFMKPSMIVTKEKEEGDDQEFILIHNAYSTLFNFESRAVYDSNLNSRQQVSGFRRSDRGIFYSKRRWETDSVLVIVEELNGLS